MAMRLSGLMSGMDTESIISQLVEARRVKVDTAKKEQTKLEWKQDAWKELNNKIKKLYDGTMSNLRFTSSYAKKVTKVSNSSVADVITSDSAMNSVQTLEVRKLAASGYLTGAEVSQTDGSKCTSGTRLSSMGISDGSRIAVTTGGKTTEITVSGDMTMGDLVTQLSNAGVKATFDSKTQRLFIGASDSGEQADFTITAANSNGTDALSKLGILVYDEESIAQYEKIAGLVDGSADYTAALDSEVASRLAAHKRTAENAEARMKEIADAYADGLAEDDEYADFAELVKKDSASRKKLEDRIAELKGIAEEDRTDEEKAELAKLEGKMSFVTAYEDTEKQLTEARKYMNDDGTASDALTAEVKNWLDENIQTAQALVANKDSLTGNATKVDGTDAEIYLNGARFTSNSNTFEINGLTITCNDTTNGGTVTLTTQTDTSGIYDMIKNFIKEYSSLINEMDKLYNAASSKGYEPLTDEEKDEMSETEIEKWETKIKDSLLRKDSTLSTVSSAFKTIMSSGFEVGGKTMYLSDFGIETLGYFEAADNEKNAYHILGDEDDSAVSGKTNELEAMIAADPDKVMDFFTQLSKSLYAKTSDLMKGVKDYSSAFTVYEDKKMKSDYDEYTKKIAQMEKKLQDYEDKWYKKFAAMETAMAKMQSNASAITGMLGGS